MKTAGVYELLGQPSYMCKCSFKYDLMLRWNGQWSDSLLIFWLALRAIINGGMYTNDCSFKHFDIIRLISTFVDYKKTQLASIKPFSSQFVSCADV